jgi:hypothetical protein
MCLGVVVGAGASTADPPSTFAGTHLTVTDAMRAAYDAGFHTESQLLAVVAIGIAESSLWSAARNWHPEYGYRPASDVIGVQGPASAWNPRHSQQLQSDRGAWQISSHWWPQYADAQTDDVDAAARIVYTITNHGSDFTPWDTYASGAAQIHYDASVDGWPAIRPLVSQFLASVGARTTLPVADTRQSNRRSWGRWLRAARRSSRF